MGNVAPGRRLSALILYRGKERRRLSRLGRRGRRLGLRILYRGKAESRRRRRAQISPGLYRIRWRQLLLGPGRRPGEPVVMTAEGAYGNLVIGFDPAADRVVLLADPLAVQLRAAAGRDR
ncbi:hypothetical protein ACFRAO_43690 [Streptomyces sp. NPDC056656]|uniref:hypothetical protein n=1 Tax=Streptomyces sp. NPDC056656 TaxID=3345895 RepID=UPI0036798723